MAETLIPSGTTHDSDARLMAAHGPALLAIAARSIRNGLDRGEPLVPAVTNMPAELREVRATFVTLEKGDDLRGCVGTIFARRPLAEDVAENAFAAAFRDHRFSPLAAHEWETTSVAISLLGRLTPIGAKTQREVVDNLKPGRDGLVLSLGARRGVFLPQVWEKLPVPAGFIAALLRKAGLESESWPAGLEAQIFQVRDTASVQLARVV
ncbi:MAG: AmmeMemoRadiSam system protein A [Rhodospirillaceae bacterium]|nr:AmmeMemoRadiSam system protein A [Rhodospirillaceae bacterium]